MSPSCARRLVSLALLVGALIGPANASAAVSFPGPNGQQMATEDYGTGAWGWPDVANYPSGWQPGSGDYFAVDVGGGYDGSGALSLALFGDAPTKTPVA